MLSGALRDGDGTPQALGHFSSQWLANVPGVRQSCPFSGDCLYPASILCTLVNSPSSVHRVGTWLSQVDGKYPVESGHGAGTQWTLSVLCL